MNQTMLEKYARLLVQVGANVQPGQPVYLRIAVDQHPFALLLTRECYAAGASVVEIDWLCSAKSVLDYTHADVELLSRVEDWQLAKLQHKADTLPVSIYIMSDDPDALASVDPDTLSTVLRARQTAAMPYQNAMDGKYQWLIAAVPSPAWAKKVFPHLPEEEAVEALWSAILSTCSLTEDNDPVALRRAHDEEMARHAQWLNEQRFTALRYSSANGTDFSVELIPGASWAGAAEVNPVNNVPYVPNLPTEEVFISPMAGKCEGTVVATKPLSWNGQIIDRFSITFEQGRAVSCKAEVGQDVLEKMIAMDENAAMLGEVALVPKESPVNQCGFLFYNTLFDENACCHLALGRGFKEVLPNGNDLTVEQAQEQGINRSIIHVDFMIGSDDLSIVGTRPDGTEVPVFTDGTWAI